MRDSFVQIRRPLYSAFLNFALNLACALAVVAQSGGSYNITSSTVSGGGGTSTNGDLQVEGTIGQSAAETSVGGIYTVSGGLNAQPNAAVQPTQTPTSFVQLSQSVLSVNEGAGTAPVTVTRSGDTSQPATVFYSTADNSGLNECSAVTGIASARCDYAVSVGTLRFATGEQSRTIYIPLIDDAYVEGPETLTITLSNATGTGLGSTSTAIITITDNDLTAGANPIDTVPFFVRQHYIDFLGREPEPSGYRAWQNILNNCAQGSTACDRIEVSSAFFRSEEFQTRAYFIYRLYSASFARIPHYSEFIPDMAKVSGFLSSEQLEANKIATVQEFMSRQEFQNKYGALNDPTTYVNALLQTVGLPDHPTRAFWIEELTNGRLTRAQVLRSLAESAEVYVKYYNESFVVMQYFGYLRREPDILYLEWIKLLNQTNDYRTLINGFLNSLEYRQRFSQ